MTASDADLVEASRRGETSAFSALVERHQGLVCGVAYARTGSGSLSEDLTQEAFTIAWQTLERLAEPSRFRHWVSGIARNLCRGAARRTGRETTLDHDAVDAAPHPDELLDARKAEAAVWAALERVPERYREVLVLYYRQGRSAEEVARALGLQRATVDQRLSRGRKFLRSEVESLVERSLERSKPTTRLAAMIVAGLPARPSPVAPPNTTGVTMKIMIAAAVSLPALVAGFGLCTPEEQTKAPVTGATPTTPDAAPSEVMSKEAMLAELRRAQREADASQSESRTSPADPYVLTKISARTVGVDLEGGTSVLESGRALGLSATPLPAASRRVSGRVVDAQGRPVGGAVVLAGELKMAPLDRTLVATDGTQAEADGRFTVAVHGDEIVPLLALHRVHGWSELARVGAGADQALELTLQPVARLVGAAMRDGGSSPATIRVFGDQVTVVQPTEADGTFEIELPAGDYDLTATRGHMLRNPSGEQGAPAHHSVQIAPGETVAWDPVLPVGGMLAAFVDSPARSGATQVAYTLVNGTHAIASAAALASVVDRLPESSSLMRSVGGSSLQTPVQFADLPAGAYTVCAEALRGRGESLGFACEHATLGPDEDREVELSPMPVQP